MNWQGKKKAVTFSYDDGVEQDIRLIALMDKYHLKGTFNLNSGMADSSNTFIKGDVTVHHLDFDKLAEVYKDHEVACHTLTHPHLEQLTDEQMHHELRADKQNLERLFGRKIVGMAYPFGTYDERVMKIVREEGFLYARTVKKTEGFGISSDLICLESTCHHNHPDLMGLIRRFLDLEADAPQLFYLWGHSYEFDELRNWDMIEEAMRLLSGHDDIFYGTNAQVLCGA